MKDINFSDYKKNQNQNSKFDTAKIPISQTEREIIERRNQEHYNKFNNIKHPNNASTKINNNRSSIQNEQINNNRKKTHGCSTIIFSFILIISIISGSFLGYVYSLCSKTKYEQTEQNFSINVENIKNQIYNVLLIGIDKEENGSSRSDTMILVTVDKSEKKIKMTSFMRDLWVNIPGIGESRLNSAYSKGGAELLKKTISENFDIHIDNYVLVDFEMFEALVDGLGGVSVEITEKEAEFINRTTHAKVEPGVNTLNGDYALIYCRIRKLDSDFMRTQRQRKVIAALIDKVKTQNLLISLKAASDTLPYITTDISAIKMTFKLLSATSMLSYTTEQIRIPIDGTYSNQTINEQAVLVPDFNENIIIIQDFIY